MPASKKQDPYEGIVNVKQNAKIFNKDGKEIFSKQVLFPDYFESQDINIVTNKYLCNESKKEETSLFQMIDRVSNEIVKYAKNDKYFEKKQDLNNFEYKLKYYQIKQFFAFNSPVYFNVGLQDKPQSSACFILSIEDSLQSISDVGKQEARIFKRGSGSGINYSKLRSSYETVTGGGTASGPISFLKSHDCLAGVIKSGGTLRRSAKMGILNVEHPDIKSFINCKEKEELKLQIIKESNLFDEKNDLSNEVYFQNTNTAVQVSDKFMKSAIKKEKYWTKTIKDNKNFKQYYANEILYSIAEQIWKNGDPGLQFRDQINAMHTCKESGDIEASNPCSEFVFLNDSACNLASINLIKFFDKKHQSDDYLFDFETFEDVIQTVITAQDILVHNSSYPSDKITENSINFRPLGLGFTNLGGLLMKLGIPYDSYEGRTIASGLSALETGIAYVVSQKLAEIKEAFKEYNKNKQCFIKVINKHLESVNMLTEIQPNDNILIQNIKKLNILIWNKIDLNKPFRNAQVTLIAPTGTISSLMGSTTTGIEPEFSLVKYKRLSELEGSTIKYVNNVLEESLRNLICSEKEVKDALKQIIDEGNVDNVEVLSEKEKRIFDTSISNGNSCINYMAHVKMLQAVQPFISGSISKTINVPKTISIDEIYNLLIECWKAKLKCVAIYRDGSKSFQPLTIKKEKKQIKSVVKVKKRKKLPLDRNGKIHKFRVGEVKGYIITGLYENGKLGEVFIAVSKQGSTLSGIFDSLASLLSISLQNGVSLVDIVDKLQYQKFEPAGFTDNSQIRIASSLVDYIFRYLGLNYLTKEEQLSIGLIESIDENNQPKVTKLESKNIELNISTNPCPICGSLLRRLGGAGCQFCTNCSWTDGSCG